MSYKTFVDSLKIVANNISYNQIGFSRLINDRKKISGAFHLCDNFYFITQIINSIEYREVSLERMSGLQSSWLISDSEIDNKRYDGDCKNLRVVDMIARLNTSKYPHNELILNVVTRKMEMLRSFHSFISRNALSQIPYLENKLHNELSRARTEIQAFDNLPL